MVTDAMMYDEQDSMQYSVSSNAYYGYVPGFIRENQQEWNAWRKCLVQDAFQGRQWYGLPFEQLQEDIDTSLCINRKRKRDQSRPIVETKKFRKEMATPALSTLQEVQKTMDWTSYESGSLDLNTASCITLEQSSMASESCHRAAGNSSLINKLDKKENLSPSDDSKSNERNAEYERLLFTTHGCSAYDHQRVQLLNHLEF